MRVEIDKIVDAFESQSDGIAHYLNLHTGELIFVADEYESYVDEEASDAPDWMREIIEDIRFLRKNPDRFLELPSQWDINEYQIMRNFCDVQQNPDHTRALNDAIRGKGAFRRFKDAAQELGVIDSWYVYRDRAFERIAVEWCESNGIAHIPSNA